MRTLKLFALGFLVGYLVWAGLTNDPYEVDVLATALVFGLFAAGVDLSWGYAGILLLGSALYFGLGAYVMAFALREGWEPLLAYPLGMGAAVVVGFAIALVGFRVRASQVHFGLMGLAISLLFQRVAVSAYDLTGGSNGLPVATRPNLLGAIDLSESRTYFFFVAAVVVGVIAALYVALRSAWGDAVRAVSADETKAEALGYDVLAVKLQVSVAAAAVIGLAGTLFTPVSGTAYPDLFGIGLSMQALVWVAIGGAGSLLGPALLAVVLKELESYLSSVLIDYYLLILGAVFVVVVLAVPNGLAGLGARLRIRVPRRSAP
jgi:ABC-type branched-subunit amino acid transport system permease subunit